MNQRLGAFGQTPMEVDIKGTIYKFSLLTVGDIREFERWLMQENCRIAADMAPTLAERMNVIAAVQARGLSQMVIGREMSTARGITFLLWRSLKRLQPAMQIEDVDKLGLTLDEMAAITGRLTGFEASPEEGNDGTNDPTPPPSSGTGMSPPSGTSTG